MARDELATRCGMSIRTLEKIEQGVIEEPKLVDIAVIAEVLGKTCADFVPNEDPEPSLPARGRPANPAPPAEPEKPAAKKPATKRGKK